MDRVVFGRFVGALVGSAVLVATGRHGNASQRWRNRAQSRDCHAATRHGPHGFDSRGAGQAERGRPLPANGWPDTPSCVPWARRGVSLRTSPGLLSQFPYLPKTFNLDEALFWMLPLERIQLLLLRVIQLQGLQVSVAPAHDKSIVTF